MEHANNRAQYALRFSLRALLLIYGLWAVIWFLADLAHFRAKAWTETWAHLQQTNTEAEPYRPADDDWQEAESFGSLAVTLSPTNPDYVETLARINELKDSDLPIGDPDARESRLKALSLYEQAEQMRPTWPYAPVEAALVKYRLGELDTGYDRDLQRADALGPWEEDVQLGVAQMGMDGWAKMSPAARQEFLNVVVRSQSWSDVLMQGGADHVWALAKTNHKDMWICGLLPRQQRTAYYHQYCDPEPLPPLDVPGEDGTMGSLADAQPEADRPVVRSGPGSRTKAAVKPKTVLINND